MEFMAASFNYFNAKPEELLIPLFFLNHSLVLLVQPDTRGPSSPGRVSALWRELHL